MMQIVPVLDIQGGIVVRAVGGRRNEYQPLVSKLTDSTDPVKVAASFRARYHLSEIYVADLDAIAGAAPAISNYDRLRSDGFRIWVDAGMREPKNVEIIAEHCDVVVIGAETCAGMFSREAEPSAAWALPRARLRIRRRGAKHCGFWVGFVVGRGLGNLE
jgi:phosphoribosylformimino-5-aminoimidazole carboxamide ribotide isomerase